MSKLTAIDWDNQELRVAVGRAARGTVATATCRAVPWDEAEQQGLTAGSFAAAAWTLQRTDAWRARGVLLARRQHLESFTLHAPPAADDELAGLVENHLVSELGAAAETACYDYRALDHQPDAARRIAITAMDGEVADEYRGLAAALKLNRPRLGVRAGGLAALLTAQGVDLDEPALVVVPNVEEIDLALFSGQELTYWRSVYCSPPADSDSFRSFLQAEVLRTLAVAEETLPEGRHVRRTLVVVGDDEPSAVLATLESQDWLDTSVQRASPQPPELAVEYVGADGPQGRFGPLLGALLAEAQRRRPPVDLFNPPTPPSSARARRPWMLAGLAAAIAVGLVGFVLWEQVDAQRQAAARLAREVTELERDVKKRQTVSRTWQAIQNWNSANMVWLDELRDLSLRFPPAGTAVALDFTASPSSGGAVIRLSGKALDPTVVTALDRELRDEYRDILSRNLREQPSAADDPFLWRFESVMNVRRRPTSAYREVFDLASGKSAAEAP